MVNHARYVVKLTFSDEGAPRYAEEVTIGIHMP